MGLTPEQLQLYGLPIRPIFSKKLPSKGTLRKKLVSSSVLLMVFSPPILPLNPTWACVGLYSMQKQTGFENTIPLSWMLPC